MDGVRSLTKLMSLASERWPNSGFIDRAPEDLNFYHHAFQDRRNESEALRSKCESQMFSCCALFHSPSDKANFFVAMQALKTFPEVRPALTTLAETHSIEVLRVDYGGWMLDPMFWDEYLLGSVVRVKFRLSHTPSGIDYHRFYADVSHVEIIKPLKPIDRAICYPAFNDVE
jgi:hypothetical protein